MNPFPSTITSLSERETFQLPVPASNSMGWDTPFFSACELSACLHQLGKPFTVVQISPGPLSGRFSVVHLAGLSLLMISTNKVLLLNGDRGKDSCCFAVELTGNSEDHRVQCQAFDPKAIYGFNQNLQESHFQLSAGSISILAITTSSQVNTFLTRFETSNLIDQLQASNSLSLSSDMHYRLCNQLAQVMTQAPRHPRERQMATQAIFISLLECFQTHQNGFSPWNQKPREKLIVKFVEWSIENTSGTKTLDEICAELYTSRRTLILGSKENFHCGPMELMKMIRLQEVHRLLRSEIGRATSGLTSVSEIASHYGFRSRGHFAKAYQEQFEENPRTTLINSVA